MQAQTAVVSAPSLTGRRVIAVLPGRRRRGARGPDREFRCGHPGPDDAAPLAVLIVGGLLGPRLGAARCLCISHLAPRVLPIFTPFGAPGVARLFGPTGGYLLAYPIAAYAVGRLAGDGRRWARLALAVLAGLALIHLGGLAQLLIITHSLQGRRRLGTWPFLVGDLQNWSCRRHPAAQPEIPAARL